MKKALNIVLFVLVAAFLLMKFVFNARVEEGVQAPNIEAELINGESFNLESLRGQYVLVDFWGSWCPPCRVENRKLVPLYHKYKDALLTEKGGLEVLSIAVEKNEKYVHRAIENDGLEWKNHIVQVSRFVLSSSLAQAYNVTDLPAKFLIDPQGNLIASNPTMSEIEEILTERLNQ